jgi:hypothetical protein
MNKALFLSGVLLALTAPAASAQLNVAWDDCGLNGTANRDFACDTDAGVDRLVGSVIAPPGITGLTSMECRVIFQFNVGPIDWSIPAWWTFGAAPYCRAVSSVASGFPGSVPGTCNMYFADKLATGTHTAGPNRVKWAYGQMRVDMTAAIDPGVEAGPVPQGEELYLFTLTIDHARTTGPTACGGCDVSACIWLQRLIMWADYNELWYDPDAGNLTAMWQGAGSGGCVGTPAKNTTWGQIKNLYR